MREGRGRQGRGENCPESAIQRIDVDILERLAEELVPVELAAALRPSEVDPVGSAVGRAGKAVALHEGLQENGADAIRDTGTLELVLMVEGSAR